MGVGIYMSKVKKNNNSKQKQTKNPKTDLLFFFLHILKKAL